MFPVGGGVDELYMCVFSDLEKAHFLLWKGLCIMKRIAVISAVLDEPHHCQQAFNDTVSGFQGIVKGRMGIPFEEVPVAVISLTVVGDLDDINSLTGKLGRIEGVTVRTAVAKTEIP